MQQHFTAQESYGKSCMYQDFISAELIYLLREFLLKTLLLDWNCCMQSECRSLFLIAMSKNVTFISKLGYQRALPYIFYIKEPKLMWSYKITGKFLVGHNYTVANIFLQLYLLHHTTWQSFCTNINIMHLNTLLMVFTDSLLGYKSCLSVLALAAITNLWK